MYALLYTTIECVNTLTYTKTIYMLNVSICLMYALLYTTIECVNTLTIQTIYMLNVSICLMYALLYTTIECVNTLTIQTIYMLNMLNVCIVVHDNRMCEHAYYTNHLYA